MLIFNYNILLGFIEIMKKILIFYALIIVCSSLFSNDHKEENSIRYKKMKLVGCCMLSATAKAIFYGPTFLTAYQLRLFNLYSGASKRISIPISLALLYSIKKVNDRAIGADWRERSIFLTEFQPGWQELKRQAEIEASQKK